MGFTKMYEVQQGEGVKKIFFRM